MEVASATKAWLVKSSIGCGALDCLWNVFDDSAFCGFDHPILIIGRGGSATA
jgi:hypothetical protein